MEIICKFENSRNWERSSFASHEEYVHFRHEALWRVKYIFAFSILVLSMEGSLNYFEFTQTVTCNNVQYWAKRLQWLLLFVVSGLFQFSYRAGTTLTLTCWEPIRSRSIYSRRFPRRRAIRVVLARRHAIRESCERPCGSWFFRYSIRGGRLAMWERYTASQRFCLRLTAEIWHSLFQKT